MFNNSYKKQAIADLNSANDQYVIEYKKTITNIEQLYKVRKKSVYILDRVEYYINSLSNIPKEFEKNIGLINVNISDFKANQKKIEIEAKKIEKINGEVAGAGAIAGAGVATLGPSAAMAIATTFGTASTGTAIATLSGAAATNAALAWLGSGALVAGGGGIAGGSALLALAGPIGWAIGGTALLGGGMFASKKNKEIAEKTEKSIIAIKKETARIKAVGTQIYGWKTQTETISSSVNSILYKLKRTGIIEFNEFNDDQKLEIMKLINSSESLSKKIGDVIK